MNATARGLSHDANPDGTDRVVKPPREEVPMTPHRCSCDPRYAALRDDARARRGIVAVHRERV